jgi:cytidylate kinase
MASNKQLVVFDFNGTARSGKGTIVNYLCETYPGTTTSEETGKDYRAITKVLLERGDLKPAMTASETEKIVSSVGEAELNKIVEGRGDIIATFGQDALYEESVNALVAGTGQSPSARKAVKAGLKRRIERVAEQGVHQVLLLDGRNLAAIIKDMPAVKIGLRIFVSCSLEEAVRRECLRKAIAVDSDQARQILKSLQIRIDEDAGRSEDAVVADSDALDYWQFIKSANAELVSTAVQSGRQIFFDTTPFRDTADSKAAMLAAARQMFDEALELLT